MKKLTTVLGLLALTCVCVFLFAQEEEETKTTTVHALSLLDSPKYPADFEYFDYVNPDAPKGGTLRMVYVGGFDTLNIHIDKGDPAVGLPIRFYESLMRVAEDDILTQYGVIAESVEVADDLSFVIYHLRPEAHFNDGSPITSEDVVFSYNILVEEGLPFYRRYYADVEKVTALSDHSVRFDFNGPPNRELPQIVGQIYILSKAYWEDKEFYSVALEPPVTSGPYKITDLESGRFIVLERDENYWGNHLPINRGKYNFDTIRYDYYRDQEVATEAFKSGEYDLRAEQNSKRWATSYDFPALDEGMVYKEMLPHGRPAGMQGFAFNTRLPQFQDPKVREAFSYCFDFEWCNESLFYGQYTRTVSYFQNSPMASSGLPTGKELEILKAYQDQIPEEVFTKEFTVPSTAEPNSLRDNLRKAVELLAEAGWEIQDGKLINTESGEGMQIEFLLNSPGFERILSPFVQNLERVGIDASIRTVEPAQYINRIREYDFDAVVATFRQSLSPGNEQRDWWGSLSGKEPGGRNIVGIQNPVVDDIIEKLVAATSREDLIHNTRALDRVLLWNHYVVPGWHIRADRVLWWDKFGRPDIKPI